MEFPILFAAAWAIILLVGGGLLTQVGDWYRALEKPWWNPPEWLFGPAWTLIMGLAAWAFVLSWEGASASGDELLLIVLYLANGLLHFIWSPLFFRARRPDWALLEVPLLWASIVALMIFLREWSLMASWLLTPYLVWVSYAWALNARIVRLNGPFPGSPERN